MRNVIKVKFCKGCLTEKLKTEFHKFLNNDCLSVFCEVCYQEREKLKLFNIELKAKGLKHCPKCNENKLFREFANNKRESDGKRCYCKVCDTAWKREYRTRHRDTVNARKQRYRFKHREEINKKQNKNNQSRKFKSMLHRANSSSRKIGTGELITAWQLFHLAHKQKLICSISGIKLTNENISLDHIIPYSKGGKNVIENIQFIDWDINQMKNSHDEKDFLEIVKRIYLHQLTLSKPEKAVSVGE